MIWSLSRIEYAIRAHVKRARVKPREIRMGLLDWNDLQGSIFADFPALVVFEPLGFNREICGIPVVIDECVTRGRVELCP